MPNADKTEIVVILDRSGSMASLKADMEGGFETFRTKQAAQRGDCVLTLVQFDTESTDVVHEALPISKVPALVLEPRGATPLLDAVGDTITSVGERLARTAEPDRPGRVLVLIITDGEENSSHRFDKGDVQRMVKHQEDVYKWAFVYLGANVDAFAEAGSMAISPAMAAAYAPSGAKAMFEVASDVSSRYRLGESPAYTDAEREKLAG